MNVLRVFISYDFNDAEAANKICDFLESNGIECWIAPGKIPSGSAVEKNIEYAFGKCTDALFLLSEVSIKSEQAEYALYLAKLGQKRGMRIFPVYLESVELTGNFGFFLNLNNSCYGIDLLSLEKLLKNLKQTSASLDISTTINANEITRTLLRDCINRYFYIYGQKNDRENANKENRFVKSTEDNQLSNDICTILLLSYIEPLWYKKNRNLLYIKEDCFGTKTSLFALLKKMVEKIESLVVFYVPLSSCLIYQGQDKIIQYIYHNYIKRFKSSLSFDEFYDYIYNDRIQTEIPRVIILIEGLDECTAEHYNDIQFELDGLITNTNIQLLLTSDTAKHMFCLGDIPVKHFKETCLARILIDKCWDYSISDSDKASSSLRQIIEEKRKAVEERIQKNNVMLEKVQERERLRESRSKINELHEKTKNFKGTEGKELNRNIEEAIKSLDGQIITLVNATIVNEHELQNEELEIEKIKLIEEKEYLENMVIFLKKFL